MIIENVNDLVKLFQACIAPVTMISGAGLLLMSMTNRYARSIDRIRILVKDYEMAVLDDRDKIAEQIVLLYMRSDLLKNVILLSSASIFSIVVTILCLFSIAFLHWKLETIAILTFAASAICLLFSMALFIQEVIISLNALRIEVRTFLDKPKE